ncbi:hypothetical protein Clacol_008156 [Clathrus columnatus]|uniref:Uncharacterized protein n=1 Tax=Clathrus columnatus TaxID=1419009 RepID=A0AAV5AMF0_9AGAM|nr:hypothetical protein Clacol_008156 [Clathrus columnatus]
MTRPHEIYRNQFAQELNRCPIWDPTHPADDPVDIGDVGYLSDDGGWIKIFNLRTEMDLNKLPPNSQPGSLVVIDQKVVKGVFVGPRFSKSVRKTGISVEIGAAEQGAVLFVADDAVSREASNKQDFLSIMNTQIQDWMEFVRREGRIVAMHELIFVTGYVRTSIWAAVAFREKNQDCQFTLGGILPLPTGTVTAQARVWASLDINAFAWTGGPEGCIKSGIEETAHLLHSTSSVTSPLGLLENEDPRHQCVLLRGYRMAERHSWFTTRNKKIKTKDGIEIISDINTCATPTEDLRARGSGSDDVIQRVEECDNGDHAKNPSADEVDASTSTKEHKKLKKTKRASFFDRLMGRNNRRHDDGAGGGAGSSGNSGGPQNQTFTPQQTDTTKNKGKSNECEHSLDTEECSEAANLNPWDILFEHIFKAEEKASFAIIHDDDLSVINGITSAGNSMERSTIYLHNSVGMFKPTFSALLLDDVTKPGPGSVAHG